MKKQSLRAIHSHRVLALTAAIGLSLALAACGGGKSDQATQPAAKVNKGEVTVQQINAVLAATRVKPEASEAASRQILERLIEQELLVQKAIELKIDSDPKVQQQIEAARRDVIARAYAERISQSLVQPTDAEIAKYYADKPALFSERRIYNIQELTIEASPERVEQLRGRMAAAKTLIEFIDYLRSERVRFNVAQAVRPAEQLPAQLLEALAQLKAGQTLVLPAPAGMQVVHVQGVLAQPLDETRARPLIEQILLNQRKAELAGKEVKALREAAKIEYLGKFADKAAASTSAPTDAASSASLSAPSASEAAK